MSGPPDAAGPPEPLRLRMTGGDGLTVVDVLAGAIDLESAASFCEELEAARSGGGDLLVDLTGCAFMDSTGLVGLIEAHNALDARGARLVVVAPAAGAPGRVLEMTVDGIITIVEDRAAAGRALGERGPGGTRR